MDNALISTTVDITQWYDFDKYAAVKTFTRRDWYVNLFFRSQARAVIFPKRFADDAVPAAQHHDVSNFVWQAIRDNPIIHAPAGEYPVPATPEMDSPLDDVTTSLSMPSVRPLTLSDLVRTQVRDDVPQALDIWEHLPDDFVSSEQAATRTQDLAKLHQALDLPERIEDGRVRLVIDLAASNERLKKDFSSWLDQARKTYRGTRENRSRHTVTDHLITLWLQKNILGYLDIMLWLRLFGGKVSDVNWHARLNPEGYERALSTHLFHDFDLELVGDKAKQAISDETLAALYRDILAVPDNVVDHTSV